MASDEPDLDDFRRQWKSELEKKTTLGAREIPNEDHKSDSEQHNSVTVYKTNASKDNTIGFHQKDDNQVQENQKDSNPFCPKDARKRKNTMKPFIIAENLLMGEKCDLAGETESDSRTSEKDINSITEQYLSKNKKIKLYSESESSQNQKPSSLLDIFISDLNEISEIPFFDVELPRELALKIFQFLDIRDLCRCAQVSQAWRSLAEDELLWNDKCHRLGWEESALTLDRHDWKNIVKEHVTRDMQIQQNWKVRSGAFRQLQYVRGGVLCAVDCLKDTVVAGYSSGEVRLYDLKEDEDCLFSPSSTGLLLDEASAQGTVPNYVMDLAIGPNHTAAFYHKGNIDIWDNRGKTMPVRTVQCGACIANYNKKIKASRDGDFFACCYGNAVETFAANGKETSGKFCFEDEVRHMQIVPTDDEVIAVGFCDCVSLHKLGQETTHPLVLHNTIGQYVTCLDAGVTQLAVALESLDEYKVRVYSIENGREESTYRGHHSSIQAVNIHDSPPQAFVTGARDYRVCVYDTRLPEPVITLTGHQSGITCVQMDDWKVVSGARDGMVCVWDQRMAARLWDIHNRHSVGFLKFHDNFLVTANLPQSKLPETTDWGESVVHSRERGSLSVHDFSEEQTREGLPDICQSNFDEPAAFNYNIRLAMPYDTV